jgi:flagellar hook-associated protein 2
LVDSIAKTLGAGSGIDVASLVESLVTNQFQLKTEQNTARGETLTAQISAVSELKSGITGFASALQSLVRGGTLQTQATSSDTSIVRATSIGGTKLAGLNSTVEVRGLASAQVANTRDPIVAGTHVGTGSLQFSFADGTSVPAIPISSADATLSGIAAKVNAAKVGITASVVADSSGERIVFKGASGEAKAFSLTATEAAGDEGLAILNIGGGATGTALSSTAADAIVAVDGVEVRRSTNSITDLVPGVRLDLQKVALGTKVTLGSTPSTDALKQAVNDFVTTYNELMKVVNTATDPATGPLARDPAARDMKRLMGQLTIKNVTGATDGSPASLAAIGVTTNRDGTLSVDATKLANQLSRAPDAVEAIFSEGAGGTGLSAAMNGLSLSVTSTITGLGASASRYSKAQTALADAQEKVAADQESAKTRLTRQFSSMDARVAVYKQTQAFLEQQIAAWNA